MAGLAVPIAFCVAEWRISVSVIRRATRCLRGYAASTSFASRPNTEGRFAIVTNVGQGDAMDAGGRKCIKIKGVDHIG
jgi:hypothetical protein